MSRIKTMILGVCVGLSVATTGLAQQNLPKVFAGCVGRLSAQMEHAWLVGDMPAADAHQSQRATFLSLLDATVAPEDRRMMLNHRIDAKQAQATLLTRATFAEDSDRARDAEARAIYFLSACRDLLLDS